MRRSTRHRKSAPVSTVGDSAASRAGSGRAAARALEAALMEAVLAVRRAAARAFATGDGPGPFAAASTPRSAGLLAAARAPEADRALEKSGRLEAARNKT